MHRLPAGVVEIRINPACVIALMKLPEAIDRSDATADTGDYELLRLSPGICRRQYASRLPEGSLHSQNRQQEGKRDAVEHAARIPFAFLCENSSLRDGLAVRLMLTRG